MSHPAPLDLDACAREPIRIPGAVQPHGALLVLDPVSLAPLQASRNLPAVAGLARAPGPGEALPAPFADAVRRWAEGEEAAYLGTLRLAERPLQVSGHRTTQGLILELEEPPASPGETLEALYPRIGRFIDAVGQAPDLGSLAALAVAELRAVTGFNRVLLYRFDRSGDGIVLAEDGDGTLPSYLGLRFPAADVPAQARELYRMNRLRLIPDADYAPEPIEPELSPLDGRPLDLGQAALRSVSPVHLQYMRNMGTRASMSISILVDGGLWGLISCHHASPRRLNAQIRTACDFIGQIVSLQIGSRERADRARERVERKAVEARLLTALSLAPSWREGLGADAADWLALVDADGAALVDPEGVITAGRTPEAEDLGEIAAWLQATGVADSFATDSLGALWPGARRMMAAASGLLAIPVSQIHPSYILWFRGEVVRTVSWGGDPRKEAEGPGALSPRRSFETWKELVRGTSAPWSEPAQETARDFRQAVGAYVLRRAEERAELSDRLERTNAELEAFSYSVSHDLRAPFRHIVGYAELLASREPDLDEKSAHYLRSIVEAAMAAGRLVDDLLEFSRAGRAQLSVGRIDMAKLVDEVRRAAAPDLLGREVEWRIGALPAARGDAAMVRQALANLVGNAIKYTAGRAPAVIRIDGRVDGDLAAYEIEDNGVGFDDRYVAKLFGVFQRLHRADEFPGTGIGLALVKRIVERHGGGVGAQGKLGQGARFTFTLPRSGALEESNGQP